MVEEDWRIETLKIGRLKIEKTLEGPSRGKTGRGEDGTVEGDGVDHERDERPCFFRVPRPVVAPRDIGPDSTKEDANGQQEYSGIEQELRQRSDSVQGV